MTFKELETHKTFLMRHKCQGAVIESELKEKSPSGLYIRLRDRSWMPIDEADQTWDILEILK